MLDMSVQILIGYEADGIQVSFGFEIAIYVRVGKACTASEESENIIASITGNDRLQNTLPVIRTVNIAIAKERSLHVSILIEAEQGMIACTLEVSIVGGDIGRKTPVLWRRER
jgi:hypothetical protein